MRRQAPLYRYWLKKHVPWWGWYCHHRRWHGVGIIAAYRWAKWNVQNEGRIAAIGGNVSDGYATSLRKQNRWKTQN